MKWKRVLLGDVCDIYQPKTISQKEMKSDGAYLVYGANGVVGRYDHYNHEDPQLLITCRGATCGTVNISTPYAWITGNSMVVRPKNGVFDLGFLECLCRGGVDLSKTITGSAQPQITRQSLATLEVPLPPLTEQRQVAGLLKAQLAAVEKARKAAAERVEAAGALRDAYVREVFEQGMDGGWENCELAELCELKQSYYGAGASFPGSRPARVLTVGDIRYDGSMKGLDEIPIRYLAPNEVDAIAEEGDLLVVKSSGSAASIRSGKTGLCSAQMSGRVAASNFIMRLVPDRAAVDPFLLWCYLNGDQAKAHVKTIAGASTYPNIKWPEYSQLEVPLPSLQVQQQLVAGLKEKFAVVERIVSTAASELAAIEALPGRLLGEVFG